MLEEIGKNAKKPPASLAGLSTEKKNEVLAAAASLFAGHADELIEENKKKILKMPKEKHVWPDF